MALMMPKEKQIICNRIALELKEDDVCNLGIGLPTMVTKFLPQRGITVHLESENGLIGMGGLCRKGDEDKDTVDAGGRHINIKKGAAFFGTCTSFQLIRGGHIDLAVLGAYQVDQEGSLASHVVPGQRVTGMGGAMDLVAGARRLVVAMTHSYNGQPKIMKKLTFPATGRRCVDMIFTEMGVMKVTEEGLVLKEIAPGLVIADIQAVTEAELIIDEDLKEMPMPDQYF